MALTRRGVLAAGAGAALCLGAGGAAAETASRRFAILRAGDEIGRHDIRLTREGPDLRVAIDIEIVVRVLGVAVYRYEMANRELWRDGALVSVDSVVNDDGEAKRVRVRREGGGLIVDGANYAGPAPGGAATTTYFSTDFLSRPVWISTDAGELFDVRAARLGEEDAPTPSGPVPATRWRVTDGDAYDVEVVYDAGGDWVGLAFDAGGERATYRLDRREGRFAALWTG